uniref:Chitin-binding type-2 domain-containing protein n=1 Tax=Anopheles atroparvus TaxID=41427 RepID=A0AAG5DRF3_ANOAO
MAIGHSRAVLCSLIALVAFASSGYCCPELRSCFPENISQVPCDGDNGPTWSLEASPTDCSMYLNCFNGIGVQSCCPVGMYFNPLIGECDDEDNVECNIVPPPCPEEPTVEPGEPTSTPGEETFPTTDETPEGPTTETPEGTPTETSEGPTTDMSEGPTTETPDGPTTETSEGPTTETAETTTVKQGSELDALCSVQPSDALIELAFPEDCNRFVVCRNRDLVSVETCPAALHFNPTLSVCDSPDHAECLEYVCQNNPEGQLLELPSLNSCQLHFLCVGNTTIKRRCAPGTVFVAENGWCEPENVDNPCQRVRPPPPPASVIEECREDRELAKIPHPEECDVYYRCLNGRLFVRQCAPGLFFDSYRGQCNLEEFVSCVSPQKSAAG